MTGEGIGESDAESLDLTNPLTTYLCISNENIDGGAYWAGRAAAHPLFSPCGQSLFFARPLFVVENLLILIC